MIFTILIILFLILILFQKQLNNFQLINGIIIIACCLYYEQSEKFVNYKCGKNSCKIYDITDLLKNEPDIDIKNELIKKLKQKESTVSNSNVIIVDILVPCKYINNIFTYNVNIDSDSNTSLREDLYSFYRSNNVGTFDFESSHLDQIYSTSIYNDNANNNEIIENIKKLNLAKQLELIEYFNDKFESGDWNITRTPRAPEISNILYDNNIDNNIHKKLFPNLIGYNENILFCLDINTISTITTKIKNENLIYYENKGGTTIFKSKNKKIINVKSSDGILLKNTQGLLELFDETNHLNVIDTYKVYMVRYKSIQDYKNSYHWHNMLAHRFGFGHKKGRHWYHDYGNSSYTRFYKLRGRRANRSETHLFRVAEDTGYPPNGNKIVYSKLKERTSIEIAGPDIKNGDILLLIAGDSKIKTKSVSHNFSISGKNKNYNRTTIKEVDGLALLWEQGYLRTGSSIESGMNAHRAIEGFEYIINKWGGWRHTAIGRDGHMVNCMPTEFIHKEHLPTVSKNINYEFTTNQYNKDSSTNPIFNDIKQKQTSINTNINKMLVENGITTDIDNIRNNIKKGATSTQFNTAISLLEKDDSIKKIFSNDESIKNILLNSENDSIKTIYVSKYTPDDPNQIRTYVILKI